MYIAFKIHLVFSLILIYFSPLLGSAADVVFLVGFYVFRIIGLIISLILENEEILIVRVVHLAIKGADVVFTLLRLLRGILVDIQDMRMFVVTFVFDILVNLAFGAFLVEDIKSFNGQLNRELMRLEKANLAKLP